MTLPFGGAVLRSLGAAQEEVNAILESTRKEILAGRISGDEEERLVLAQLGILTETDEDDEPSAPMVAEVIEAAACKVDKTTQADQQTSSEADADANKEIAPIVAEVMEAAAGKVEKTTQIVDIEVIQKTIEVGQEGKE